MSRDQNPSLPDHYVKYNTEKGIENIVSQIHNYALDHPVFLDNSEFCWLANYLSKTPVKRLNTEFMGKAAMQFEGINEILKKKEDIHIPKEIANEIRQSAEITLINLNELYSQYQQLTAPTQETFADVKKAMDRVKSALEYLQDYAKSLQDQTEDPVASSLADFLNDIKSKFMWGEKAGNKDIHLVANAFSKAMTTGKEVYIITEDRDIEQIAECLHRLLSCRQTGTDMMFRAHPANVSVLKAQRDSEYTAFFDYKSVLIGSNYDIRLYLRQFFERGTVEGSRAVQNAQERIFELAKKQAVLINSMLNSKAMQEQLKPAKVSDPDAIQAEAESLRMEAERLEESADLGPAPAEEPAPAEPEQHKEPAPALTEIVEKDQPTFSNTLEIIRDYIRKAYEKPGETPERKTAKSALEELANAGMDVKEDLKNIRETEIKQEINALATEIPQIRTKMKQIVDTKPEWDDDPEYIKLNQDLTLKKDKKKELQSKIYREPDENQ